MTCHGSAAGLTLDDSQQDFPAQSAMPEPQRNGKTGLKLAVDLDNEKRFGSEEFGKIFDEAAEFMGLPGQNAKNIENASKRFSDDILKMELSGPDQHHLSVVDVPGLFHNPTKYQTADDRAIIRRLIESYITDKRTIILLLYGHIRSEFPNVVKDIESHMSKAHKALELLGPSRQTSIDQRRFLTRVANKYQREVSKALSGNYDPAIGRESPLKLRMHTRVLSDAFAKAIAVQGHTKVFQTVRGVLDTEYTRGNEKGKQGPDQCIIEWIRTVYRDSRGTELPGTVNPSVLENLFRQQTASWEPIANNYIQKVTNAVKAYNGKVLPTIITESDVLEKLLRRLVQTQEAAYSAATTEFCRILNDERDGILQTVNHYFADNLNAIREERVRFRLQQARDNEG
ncbi:hypothetical protein BJY01DRAFT_247426 [Aspergillus pseudoustus]|uniref:Dynamin stalk domain-containing protein n=1 Tax=Aspergillus pseudoustus TaxID=1810923 RepID=A0ABR4K1L8_9EURO